MNWKRRNDFDYKYELLKDEFNKLDRMCDRNSLKVLLRTSAGNI